MRMECCGKIIKTPFCPICGKEVGGPESLLSYLKQELAESHTKVARADYRMTKPHSTMSSQKRDEGVKSTASAKVRRIGQWIAWIESELDITGRENTNE